MRRLIIYTILIVVFGGIIFAGYTFISNFTYTRHITLPPQLLASSTDEISATSTASINTTYSAFGQSAANPASSTIDTSLWEAYNNPKLGFSLQYPADFVINTDTPGSVVLFVPKANYFHWPLLDDVKVTITASSSCPVVMQGLPNSNSGSVAIGSSIFKYSEGSDVAAGNIYREQAYDLMDGTICYHLDLFDHGSNGAGLYVSDQSLIAQYDNQHQTDLTNIVAVFYNIVESFRIVSP